MKQNQEIKIIALAAIGTGLSGGDRIATQFALNWSQKNKVEIITWKDGEKMYSSQGIRNGKRIKISSLITNSSQHSNFIYMYLKRLIVGIDWAIKYKQSNSAIIYSASEFWMDSIPAFILKLKNKQNIWVSTWYQTAPNPLKGFSESKRENAYYWSAFLYWLVQIMVKPLIAAYADYVLVNNELEQNQFRSLKAKKRTIVVYGAVDSHKITNWLNKHKTEDKIYDAVFQGRFHPQKGVVELIEIWSKVVKKKPDAKLAMIGDGPLRANVERKIEDLNLGRNVRLLGYLFDGARKYKTFSQSRLVVHPSFYDSGGMAAAEAMAFGVPAIGFALKAYTSYYPKGMLKVGPGNLTEFADQILKFLKNNRLRIKLGKQAQKEIMENWSWQKRSTNIINKILPK